MAGKRNQGVLRKYLLEASEDVMVKGVPLAERLYVPEPFSEGVKEEAAQRRREKLALLHPHDGQAPLAVVIGEFKASEATVQGYRVWIRHMPDAPLLIAAKSWARIERVFGIRPADSTFHRIAETVTLSVMFKSEGGNEGDGAGCESAAVAHQGRGVADERPTIVYLGARARHLARRAGILEAAIYC